MAQIVKLFSLILVLLVMATSGVADTLHVGSCHSGSYATISAAVAAAPDGSLIEVCPGTYPEQVFITRGLTLEGVKHSNADRARIIVPTNVTGGPPKWQFVPDPDGGPTMVAPQIYVNAPGPVNITNLTIDASGEMGAPACLASGYWRTTAILYENTSGTIKRVSTLGQGKNSGCGDGIRAFAPAIPATVTLSESSMQDAGHSGLILEGAGLTANVTGNQLSVSSNNYSISSTDISGTISSNFIEGEGDLLFDSGSGGPITISNNVVNGPPPGAVTCSAAIVLLRSAQVTGNKTVGCQNGISIIPPASGAITLKNNTVFETIVGIDLGCDSNATVTGDIVNGAVEGVQNVPTSFSLTGITFANVDTVISSSSCL